VNGFPNSILNVGASACVIAFSEGFVVLIQNPSRIARIIRDIEYKNDKKRKPLNDERFSSETGKAVQIRYYLHQHEYQVT
jgi:hypothetical protein